MASSGNRLIVRNAVMIYFRMFISMVVSLYTSRVVLQVLGASDYGVYVVVGGIVTMMSFLNNALSGSTSRFLNYAMGLHDKDYLRGTFQTALLIHVIIALLIIVLSESVGLWFLNNKLVIPADRMGAAHIILQLSIITMCIGVIQGPFNACTVAHEKMDVFAYVEILNVVLKLLIVYLLETLSGDKLIIYAFLLFAVSALIMGIYVLYSKRHFSEVTLKPKYKKGLFRPMLSYSGWRFFGCFTDTVSAQGRNMILNIFWGTLLNAAAGIANTVQSVVSGFAYNIMVAFRPQIVMNYAEKNYNRMQFLMEEAFMLTNILFMLVGVPLIVECEFVLHLWLGDVPEYTVSFVRIALIASIISNNYGFEGTIIGAAGNIKLSQIIIGLLNLATLFSVYFLLRLGYNPLWAYYPLVIAYLIMFISNFILIKKYIPAIHLKTLLINGFLKDLLILIACVGCSCLICHIMPEGFLRFFVNIAANSLTIFIVGYYLVVPQSLKTELKERMMAIFKKKTDEEKDI